MNSKKINRTIERVLEIASGQFILASDFFKRNEGEIFTIRRKIEEAYQNKDELYECDICFKPVKICGGPQRILHFKHFLDAPKCPYYNGKSLSKKEILRRQYHGQKESKRHIDLKNQIAEVLFLNEDVTNIVVDTRKYSSFNPKRWRQPDVQATYKGKELVFEIQLSTTFLSILVERDIYYKNEGVYIIWVFDSFDLKKFTHKDVFYPSRRNAFVFDSALKEESERRCDLVLSCHHEIPKRSGSSISSDFEVEQITLADLTFDKGEYKPYYFDFDKRKAEIELQIYNDANKIIKLLRKYYGGARVLPVLKNKVAGLKGYEKEYVRKYLKDAKSGSFLKELVSENNHYDFLGFISEYFFNGYDSSIQNECYSMIDSRLDTLSPPKYIRKIFYALGSLKINCVLDYKHPTLLGLSNHIFDQRSDYANIYLKAVNIYNRMDTIKAMDKKGTFWRKRNQFLKEKPSQSSDFDDAFKVVFPELF